MKNTQEQLNDLLPFKHGSEGSHYACADMANSEGPTECCACTGHKCQSEQKLDWEARFKAFTEHPENYTDLGHPLIHWKLQQFIRDELARRDEEIKHLLKKEIKSGNPLSTGSGKCLCTYDKEDKRFGMCLRCVNDQLHEHRKGELKMAKKILAILSEKGVR